MGNRSTRTSGATKLVGSAPAAAPAAPAPETPTPEATADTAGNETASSPPSDEVQQPSASENAADAGASTASENTSGAEAAPEEPPAIDFQAKYEDLLNQVQGLASVLIALDLRGTEDGGACEIAGIRLAELKAAVAESERELADVRKANAEEFAERADRQVDRANHAEASADYAAAVEGKVETFASLPPSEAVYLRFANGDSFLPDAPQRLVLRGDVKNAGGGRVSYEQKVAFAPEAAPFSVTEAWLIAGGKAVRCSLSYPLPVGGGAQAEIPAGHLAF